MAQSDVQLLKFDAWTETVHRSIREDALWQFKGYQKASYAYYLAWHDCGLLSRDLRGKAIAEQLIRSAGSISANIEEGFGKGFGRDYARFLTIALGSARETRGWYQRASLLLSSSILDHRLKQIEEIIAILVITGRQQRSRANQ